MIPHLHDPCIYCGTPHDEVEAGDCPDPNNPWRMNSVGALIKERMKAMPGVRVVELSEASERLLGPTKFYPEARKTVHTGGYGTFIPRAK